MRAVFVLLVLFVLGLETGLPLSTSRRIPKGSVRRGMCRCHDEVDLCWVRRDTSLKERPVQSGAGVARMLQRDHGLGPRIRTHCVQAVTKLSARTQQQAL